MKLHFEYLVKNCRDNFFVLAILVNRWKKLTAKITRFGSDLNSQFVENQNFNIRIKIVVIFD